MIGVVLIVLGSYLLGSLPTSIIVGRVFFGKDPRDLGSGNAGGTNAFRVFGWKGGVPTVLVDVAKGLAATLLISRIPVPGAIPHELMQIAAGCAAIVGHVWTVFAGFRGGKGVATAAGMLVGLYPVALLVCIGLFGITLITFGIVSVASLCAALLFPLVLLVLDAAGVAHVSPLLFWFSLPVVLLIFYTHRANIGRLLRGQENRFPKLMLFSRIFHKI
ncbi:MAG: glycerol-3-phosphate 1-O-acyltransferase PlsY [Spirochaetia bacterium]